MNPLNNPTPVRPDAQARRSPPPPPPLAVTPAPPAPAPSAPRPQETPLSTIEQMVRDAHSAGASDVHVRVGQVPRFRIRGMMQIAISHPKVTPEIFEHYLAEILTPEQRKQFVTAKELDTAIFYPGFVRCRLNCFESLNGGAIVLRLISLNIPTIDSLRLPYHPALPGINISYGAYWFRKIDNSGCDDRPPKPDGAKAHSYN